MGKSSPTPPAVASPSEIANAAGTANVATAGAQAALNNVNQVTPYGTTTYNQTGSYATPYGNVPTYTQNVQLSPLEQQIFEGQQQAKANTVPATEQLATQAGQAATTPLNFNTADSATLNQGPQQLDTNAANALYGQQKSFLDPQWGQNEKDLQDQLSRQGIPVGSDAYNNAMTNFNNSKTQAYQSAQDAATAQGSASAANLFNLALSGQNQNINQQITAQNQPLSLLNSLLGNGVPQYQGTSAAQTQIQSPNVEQAYATSQNAAMQQYQAQLQQQNSMFGGLAGIAGSVLGAGLNPGSAFSSPGFLYKALGL